jgi:serine/threonine protein kinase/formylglycine-generating enzyme required for sulfatase activity
MNAPLSSGSAPLSREARGRIADACTRFHHAWDAGLSPRLEDFLPANSPPEERRELLRALLEVEFRYRQQTGESWYPDDYLRRFPDDTAAVRSAFPGQATTPDEPSPAPPPPASPAAREDIVPPFLGRYRIEAKLGGGTFGIVYRGRDDLLGRDVAIKVPRPDLVAALGGIDSYLQEARVLAGLDHPNIVPVHDVGLTSDGFCFVVYGFVEGSDLKAGLARGRFAAAEAARLVASLAEALQHAHQRGVYHRDVKPANILVDRRGKAYLADFGLALRHDDYGQGPTFTGTPAYMSPEQARHESHRVDGRSDIFSLGAVLYELLTGQRAFQGSREQVRDRIACGDVRPPRQFDAAISPELERICLKALARLVSDRYTTAQDLADDLRAWLATAEPASLTAAVPPSPPGASADSVSAATTKPNPVRVVPKGLRSFDAGDADFFLELLPGPRDRDGLPDSLRFWKRRVEQTDPEQTFAVGLLYGPSGCGKSSLVKAGLLPRLAEYVIAVHVEATPDDTEARLRRGLHRHCPGLGEGLGLVESIAALRSGRGLAPGQKVLLVLDQFEQWLHARQAGPGEELVQALRQCDGGRVQALIMVRDDFWMAVTRFLRELEVRLIEGENSAAVDLFNADHAGKILATFGRAFGKLPDDVTALTKEQQGFLSQAVAALAQDGKVICVRLALFAEMMKGRPWTIASLREVGGVEGVGATFLEETFSAQGAPVEHRYHQLAARRVLQALLPEVGSDIKGTMRSQQELLNASGYADRPKDFDDLIRILDRELRLLTPTDSDRTEEKYFQLTHDYLVPSLRDWLSRKQKETRRGRAEQRLAERASLWQARPEPRQLPSLTEWLAIRLLTTRRTWTGPERQMMRAATRRHLVALSTGVAVVVLFVGLLLFIRAWEVEDRAAARAKDIILRLLDAKMAETPAVIAELDAYRRWADPLLEKVANDPHSRRDHRLRARLALLPVDGRQADVLLEELLEADSQDFPVLREALAPHAADLAGGLWDLLETEAADSRRRFRAAAALASYDPENRRWDGSARARWVAEQLVGQPSLELSRWVDALRPVRGRLTPALASLFQARPTPVAAEVLGDYAADQPEVLANALADSRPDSFAVLFPRLVLHGDRAVPAVATALDRTPQDGDGAPNAVAARRANLAIALLRLGTGERLWPMMKASPNPRCRSFIIDRLPLLGCEPAVLLDRLTAEPDDTVRSALLLGLGGFDERVVPSDRRVELLPRIAQLHRTDSSAAVHAAARWLLGKWDRQPEERAVEDGGAAADRGWYVNRAGITMVRVAGPVTFLMGAPPDEARGDPREPQHQTTIDHAYDIGMTEVTNDQFLRFLRERPDRDKTAPPPTRPGVAGDAPINRVTWYDAAAYCNWLTDREGLPPGERCYEPAPGGRFDEGMKIAAGFQFRRGYRLPTEAEWEYACRGGAATSRCYGDAAELLPRYAWYAESAGERNSPVARLLPNAFGLFDMHGNAAEWCLDIAQRPGAPPKDYRSAETVLSQDYRVVRGGHIATLARWIRSAKRFSDRPTAIDVAGFRLARSRP